MILYEILNWTKTIHDYKRWARCCFSVTLSRSVNCSPLWQYSLPGLSVAQHTFSLMSAYMITLCVGLWDIAAPQMLLPSLWQAFKSALEMDKILMIDTCFHEILGFLYVKCLWKRCYFSLKFCSVVCMTKGYHSNSGDKCTRVSFLPSSFRVCDWSIFNFWWQRFWFMVGQAITGFGCQQSWWEPF